MISFRKILELNGFPIIAAEHELSKVQRLTEVGFNNNLERKKWEIFNHHKLNNLSYQNFIKEYNIQDWEQIPILTKSDLQVSIKERLSKGFNVNNVYINNTSGSSGHPFFYAKDKFCHAMTWAVIFDRFGRHGLYPNISKQARFYGIPLGFQNYYREKLKDLLMNRVRFPVFDLSDAVLEKYFEKFTKTKFDYLNGYTSSLVLFAKYCLSNNLVLNKVCPTLQACVVTSEMCSNSDKDILENGFGVPVINEYGTSELDLIAFQDQDLDWIITNETLFVEILDDQNRPVPDGESGKLVITSLYNKAMPFIRYEIGDIASVKKYRKGNYQVLQSLIGRTNDVAILPSGKKSPGLTFYYVSKALLEGSGGMKEFIIIQNSRDTFTFEYVADQELSKEQIQKVYTMMNRYLEPGLKGHFIRKEKLDRQKSGKLKHFRSEL